VFYIAQGRRLGFTVTALPFLFLMGHPISRPPLRSQTKPPSTNETRQHLAQPLSLCESTGLRFRCGWLDHLLWQTADGPPEEVCCQPRWELTWEPGSQAAKPQMPPPHPWPQGTGQFSRPHTWVSLMRHFLSEKSLLLAIAREK
jgi:hypothetical protein